MRLALFIFLLPAIGLCSDADCSFLLSHLLKPDLRILTTFQSLSDLQDKPDITSYLHEKWIAQKSKPSERWRALKGFPISAIVAAPGHRILRKPGQVDPLAQYIHDNKGGNFKSDQILLNILTDYWGNITGVDVWNAHHRLVAYLKDGYKTVSDLPKENVDILVNGFKPNGHYWPHFLPSAGIEVAKIKDLTTVEPGGDIRIGTVSVPGYISNYDLGSRNTVGQLKTNTYRVATPHIGVYFGTFDPIHEGHVQLGNQAKTDIKLDQVLFVPNLTSIEKPDASPSEKRLKTLSVRIEKEPGLNLYTGDSKSIIDHYGREPFLERVAQIYGTHNLYQVIGGDSFNKLVRQGHFDSAPKIKYIVHPRGEKLLAVPDSAKSSVIVLQEGKIKSLSSTEIRNKIKKGIPVTNEEIDPDVLNLILGQ